MSSTPTFVWRYLGLVVLGGALGAMARAALLWPVTSAPELTIIVTAIINVVGAFALGLVTGVVGTKHPSARAFLGTGMLGGFTTYSAFAVQVATSTPWVAVLLALLSVGVGVVAAGLGLKAGRALDNRAGDAGAAGAAEPREQNR